MESQRISQQPVKTRAESGFTFLELMAVMSLLLLFASLIVVQFDLTDFRSDTELDQLRSLFRSQQMQALNRSTSRTILVTSRKTPSFQVVNGDTGSGITLQNWDLSEPAPPFRFYVAPTGVYGPESIRLKSNFDREIALAPDRFVSLKRMDDSNE